MKYIRTKDGIYRVAKNIMLATLPMRYAVLDKKEDIRIGSVSEKDVIQQADTIEELIMPGDLVRYNTLYMSWIEKDRGDKVRGIDMNLIPRESVDMLWIPSGNDAECYPNFKLVASKEDEKGELELL